MTAARPPGALRFADGHVSESDGGKARDQLARGHDSLRRRLDNRSDRQALRLPLQNRLRASEGPRRQASILARVALLHGATHLHGLADDAATLQQSFTSQLPALRRARNRDRAGLGAVRAVPRLGDEQRISRREMSHPHRPRP